MTSAEWDKAFQDADPEVIGGRLLDAIRQAHEEQDGALDIGELSLGNESMDSAEWTKQLMTRAATIFIDKHGK